MTSAVNLHYPVAADALRQVLVGRPDADLLHTIIYEGDLGRRGKRVVSLQLGHGPYSHTHSGECFFERVELREERGLDAVPCLVAGPETVAEGLDDVIGRHTDVSGSRLDHLQHSIQHSDHGAEGPILALGEAAKAVEVAEQLVRAVYEMNDHAFVTRARGEAPGLNFLLLSTGAVGIGVPNSPAESLSSPGPRFSNLFLPILRRCR